jgi:Fe2+ or Zn2+ uptake regulation protein
VLEFIQRVKAGRPARPRPAPPAEARRPVEPFAPIVVPEQFALMPRLESLTLVKGEHVCSNEDLIRNAAYSWSPMTADDIQEKTGIEQRLYTERRLEHISLQAARAALEGAGRRPAEIGSVIFFGMVAISELDRMVRGADTNSIIGVVREGLGEVSPQAVYDVLRALTAAGLVRRIVPPGSVARYESRVGDSHHHVVCRSCGAIADVDCAVGTAPCLTAFEGHGYAIDEAEVVYWGLCPGCSAGHRT